MEFINFEMYKVFCSVAKNKNITKAANELLISQPAITQTIKKLEEQIGYKLFYRNSKGVTLTTHGEILYKDIEDAVDKLNTCQSSLESNLEKNNSVIRIGGGSTLLKYNALDAFKEYKKKYPNIKIIIERGITNNLLKDLSNNNIDIVLCNNSNYKDENLKFYNIESVRDVFVANSEMFSNLLNKSLSYKDILDLPLVLQSKVSTSRRYLDNLFKKEGYILESDYNLESYDLVLSFVKAGLGIGFINQNHIKEELYNNTLFVLNTNFNISKRNISVAINKKNLDNKFILDFVDILKK